jgi:hypothetical protein
MRMKSDMHSGSWKGISVKRMGSDEGSAKPHKMRRSARRKLRGSWLLA